jgi:hypothetical protein
MCCVSRDGRDRDRDRGRDRDGGRQRSPSGRGRLPAEPDEAPIDPEKEAQLLAAMQQDSSDEEVLHSHTIAENPSTLSTWVPSCKSSAKLLAS